MKRITSILVLLFVVIAIPLQAQIFDAGIYGGLTSSQIEGDDFSGYNKPGFMAGTFVKTAISKTFDLKIAIQYISKGARNTNEDKITDYKIHFDYIELPFSIIWKTKNRFSFEGGIAPAYLFNVKLVENGYPIDDDGNFTDFDLNGFAAVHYQLGKKMDLGFRIAYSAISARSIRRYYHNNSLGIFLAYNFQKEN